MTTLIHPRKTIVSLAEAQKWNPSEYLIQRKVDGELTVLKNGDFEILCEFMRPKSGGFRTAADESMFRKYPNGWYAALTVKSRLNENILNLSTKERWDILLQGASYIGPVMVVVPETKIPNALTSEEGYCAHRWDAPWGDMLVVKQQTSYLCKVTSLSSTQSVGISMLHGGENIMASTSQLFIESLVIKKWVSCGNVKLGGGARDQVRVGSIIRCEGMGLTGTGKIREPRKCREWLVKY